MEYHKDGIPINSVVLGKASCQRIARSLSPLVEVRQKGIFVENLRKVDNKGNLRALCDVLLSLLEGDVVIRDCRIIQQLGQRAWLSMPVVSWQDEQGVLRYKTMIELPHLLKQEVSKAALEAYLEAQGHEGSCISTTLGAASDLLVHKSCPITIAAIRRKKHKYRVRLRIMLNQTTSNQTTPKSV